MRNRITPLLAFVLFGALGGACGDEYTINVRQNLTYYTQENFRGGINQEPSSRRPNEVLDARNVYINQEGDLVKRPGVRFDSAVFSSSSQTFQATLSPFVFVGGTLYDSTQDVRDELNALNVGDTFHVGLRTPLTDIFSSFPYIQWNLTVTDPSVVQFNADSVTRVAFWNGATWQEVETLYRSLDLIATRIPFQEGAFNRNFLFPAYTLSSWQESSLGGQEAYWMRITAAGEDFSFGSTGFRISDVFLSDLGDNVVVGAHSIQKGSSQDQIQLQRQGTVLRFTTNSDTTDNLIVGDEAVSIPSTVAVIPEFSKTYIAYNNVVYDASDPTDVVVAQVNDDPTIIGDTANEQETDVIYDEDTIAQLDEFPEANYILYFKGRLWAAGIKDESFTVRWSGPTLDGAYNVWPQVSFEVLSEDDNSPITGLASLNEHPVVFKRDSIWVLVFTGTAGNGLPLFAPIKVVSGIGSVSQASIQNVNGRLIFLAEDGFYAFDGKPNVQKLSDKIDRQVSKIVPSRKPFATATHWRTKNLYICAASIDGADENNFVFVFDYKNGGWWFWDGLSVQSWLREEDQFDRETISFGDTQGRIFELTDARRTDAGKPIEAYITPMRLGYGDGLTKAWRDFRIWANNSAQDATLEILKYDEGQGENSVLLTDSTEAKWDDAVWDESVWVGEKRRTRKLRIRETAEWIQPKISHDGTEKFELYGYSVGARRVGIR